MFICFYTDVIKDFAEYYNLQICIIVSRHVLTH